MTEEIINVEMTIDDALLFKAFREHQENFSILLAAGVFNIRGGQAKLNFDIGGTLAAVDVDVPTFRRGKQQIQYLSNAQ